MQREGAGPNLNRELLLRLRRAAPKLDYTLASTWRLWAVLATADAAAPAARNRNINSHWEFPLSLAAATCPVNSKCVNRGNASAYISYSQNT